MNRASVARRCVQIEKKGGNVLEYLSECGCYSPRATWINLQREELHRPEAQMTDGKGGSKPKLYLVKERLIEVVLGELAEGRDPVTKLFEMGYKDPNYAYQNLKHWCKRNDPENYKKFPETIRRGRPRKAQTVRTMTEGVQP